jgi:hypothetical protein
MKSRRNVQNRKSRNNRKSRKYRGGVFGLHFLKTNADNRKNCMKKYGNSDEYCSQKMLDAIDYHSDGTKDYKKHVDQSQFR